ncbi:MAG: hypothetical protein O8C61_08355 [Candidatus Methanoperedens sp.]|nr:hypothetical protein [Candidatus Methanoperedens sp.]
MKKYNCNIAVIVDDSKRSPLRLDALVAGIELVGYKGRKDIFRKPFLITRRTHP